MTLNPNLEILMSRPPMEREIVRLRKERDEWRERCRNLCDPPHNGYWAEILAEARQALGSEDE